MPDELTINRSTLRLVKGDITCLDTESFVFYARHDLVLGSGYGTAISLRGGPSVQDELKQLGPLSTGEAMVTSAGEMRAKYIIHAVGPRFQEDDLEGKLRTTVLNALRQAETKGITAIAFPAMGAGFYGVPLPVSARVTLESIRDYLSGATRIKEVVVCLLDNREFTPFLSQLELMSHYEGATA